MIPTKVECLWLRLLSVVFDLLYRPLQERLLVPAAVCVWSFDDTKRQPLHVNLLLFATSTNVRYIYRAWMTCG